MIDILGTSSPVIGEARPSATSLGKREHINPATGKAQASVMIGLAPGPILTGRIADGIGLAEAFRLLPIPCLLAALTFAAMRCSYLNDLRATSS